MKRAESHLLENSVQKKKKKKKKKDDDDDEIVQGRKRVWKCNKI